MSIKDIFNFIEISDAISTSGQPTPFEFEVIANAGFQHVINLAMHDSDNALPEEGSFVAEAGMNYFHIPVPFDAPTIDHLQLFLKQMSILEGDKVWVHCALNHRISAFMQHYQRSVMHRTEDEIIPMVATWKPSEVWQEFIKLDLKDD
ncbi:protein tyrosine phosphatase family protein [uncultured Cocleimonas sp.]|uniref:protein tyrosine phosphatase family protein n=1 Tax=uncultured Cocleimonas sp. TaxID=1051587 RepID=UPI00260C8307|nr:protein tyrosine phosphatase family protein [uncultured Cocleimonas sp.]